MINVPQTHLVSKAELDRLATSLDLIATCEGAVRSLEFVDGVLADRICSSTAYTLGIIYNMAAELVVVAERAQVEGGKQ